MINLIENMIRNIRDFGIEKVFKRYYSLYRGQVVSNSDPEKRGRVEVKVPAVFGDKVLPIWAEPRDFRGASSGKGEFYPPEVDDWVYIEFELGDPKFPVYSGGYFAEKEADEEFPYDGDKPAVRGFVSKYGHAFKFDETAGKEKILVSTPQGHFFVLDDTTGKEGIYLIHKTGAQLQIDKDGSVKLLAKDGSFVALDAVNGAATITSKSGAFVTVKDEITATDSSGKSFVSVKEDSITLNTGGDLIGQSNSFSLNTGSFLIDTMIAKMSIGSGKIAMGTAAAELVDQLIQALNALVTSPSLVTTGTGPSSPLMPPASVQLTTIISLLTAIKGTLP